MEADPNNRNTLASLTEDLVLEILRRLPVHFLFSCKCVLWCTPPYFEFLPVNLII